MSYITAMASLSPQSARFVTYLAGSNVAKSLSCSISLARVLASTLSMPAEDVSSDAGLHFRMTHQTAIGLKFDAFNELCVHDRNTVLKLVESFYVARAQMTFMRPTTSGIPGSPSALYNFFGLSTGFSKEVLDHIATSPSDFTLLCDGYNELLKDLSRQN